MEATELHERENDAIIKATEPCGTIASGLFGYSILDGRMGAFKPTAGYLRDMEQMPNFAPPSAENFVAQYVRSNIGKPENSF